MTKERARMEILLICVKAIRSVFFNLFMLGLGFVLGFGFYSQYHKVFDRSGHIKFQRWASKTGVDDAINLQETNDFQAAESSKDGK